MYGARDPKSLPFLPGAVPCLLLQAFLQMRWGRGDGSLTSTDVQQRSLPCFPRDKSYQGKAITEHRVLSYHQLLKQDTDTGHSGDCHGLLPPLQCREGSSPPGMALPTAQTCQQSSDGFPAGDLSSARSRSLAGGAAPRTGAGTCWGVRHRRARLPRNAHPQKRVSVMVALSSLEVHVLVSP